MIKKFEVAHAIVICTPGKVLIHRPDRMVPKPEAPLTLKLVPELPIPPATRAAG